MSERTGFFEEAPGVRSMARLAIQELIILAFLVVAIIGAYVWWTREKAQADVILALVAGLTAVMAKGAVAIWRRNAGDEPEDKPV